MHFNFSSQFKSDLKKLKKENPKNPSKVLDLITSIDDNPETPLQGIGQPEKLKGNYFSGCYSRRITQKHRLIYRFSSAVNIDLISCYGHYDDK